MGPAWRASLHGPPHAPLRAPHAAPSAAAPTTDLVNPVRVDDAQAPALAPHALLGHIAQVARRLELRDALAGGLAVHDALRAAGQQTRRGAGRGGMQQWQPSMRACARALHACSHHHRPHLVHGALAAAAAHAHAVHHEALLGLVAHAAGLVGARGPGDAHDARQLAVLPAPHAQQEAEHVALLLLPQLLHVLRGAGTGGRSWVHACAPSGPQAACTPPSSTAAPCRRPWLHRCAKGKGQCSEFPLTQVARRLWPLRGLLLQHTPLLHTPSVWLLLQQQAERARGGPRLVRAGRRAQLAPCAAATGAANWFVCSSDGAMVQWCRDRAIQRLAPEARAIEGGLTRLPGPLSARPVR